MSGSGVSGPPQGSDGAGPGTGRPGPGLPRPMLAEGNPLAAPSPAETAAVERALARVDGPLAPGAERSRLLPALHALQAEEGWLSRGALQHLADRLGLPFPDVWGVATFYALFRMTPPRGVAVQVCDDVPCLLRGAGELLAALEARWGPAHRFDGEAHTAHGHAGGAADGHGGDGAPPGAATADLEAVPCLGQCDGAPAARVAGRLLRCAAFEAVIAAAAQAAAAQGAAAAGADPGRGGGERRG